MSDKLYNNLGICSLGIAFTLNHFDKLPLSKAFLILPLITHRKLLGYLSNQRVQVKSIEKTVIDKTAFFSNFNQRYFDSIQNTINSIQFLNEIELLKLQDANLIPIKKLVYEPKMGKRANKLNSASKNISSLLTDTAEKLYLNLRVEL
ncbi:MAG: DUF6521 family protein [Myxococcota bacterium]|nr:DUF6521 family protein [Myxococcota bacterium]